MRVLSFPLRLTADGSMATTEQWSARHAQELAAVAASVRFGERALSPLYGSADPVGDVSHQVVAAGIEASEPGLVVHSLNVAVDPDGRAQIVIAVRWEDA